MSIVASYANPEHTAVIILSGYPGAPCLGENGNPHNKSGQEIWDAAHANGNVPTAYKDPDPTIADFARAIDNFLNEGVQPKGYDSIHTCVSYVTSTNPAWKAEATTAVAWRDAVYAVGYTKLAEVEAGAPAPTISEFIALLPTITWP